MQNIKIEKLIIILFLDILTQCFNDRTVSSLKKNDMLDKENKLDNDSKKKLNEFIDLLKKTDKLVMAIIFVNSEKIVQKYILSLYFHLFLVIKIDKLQNFFNCFRKCIGDENKTVILNAIDANYKIHKCLNSTDINNSETKFFIENNTLHIQLP